MMSDTPYCTSIIRATLSQLSLSCTYLVELDRALQPSEQRNFLQRLASFPRDRLVNNQGVFFRYRFPGEPTKILLACGGVFNDPNREMMESKAKRINGTNGSPPRRVARKTTMENEPKMDEVVRLLRVFLANCCISVQDGPILSRADRQYDKLELLVPSGLFPSGSLDCIAPVDRAPMARKPIRPARRFGHP